MEEKQIPKKLQTACEKWCEQHQEKITESYLFFESEIDKVDHYKFVVKMEQQVHDEEMEKVLWEFEMFAEAEFRYFTISTVLLPALVGNEMFVPSGMKPNWERKKD